ncbi:MAG TPA: hypothetical protein VJ489_01190 [Thermoplasmata archaeon]|nr:hypothetical protein [Thermoplasmata archaeon]
MRSVRPTIKKVADARLKRKKELCPECGKDVHDPDCAYYRADSE